MSFSSGGSEASTGAGRPIGGGAQRPDAVQACHSRLESGFLYKRTFIKLVGTRIPIVEVAPKSFAVEEMLP